MNDNLLKNNNLENNIENVDDFDNDIETLNFDNDEIENLEPHFTKIISEKISNDLDFYNEEIEEINDLEESSDLVVNNDFHKESDNQITKIDNQVANIVFDEQIENNEINEKVTSNLVEVSEEDKQNKEDIVNNDIKIEESNEEVPLNNDIKNEESKEEVPLNNNILNSREDNNKEYNVNELEDKNIKTEINQEFENNVNIAPTIEENKEETNISQIEIDNNSLLAKYGENISIKKYVCNPAIGRDNEIKQLILTLLTPEKSGILVGKPGIGKTAIVEGLGYHIQKGTIPDALKDYQIYKLNTSSLLGIMPGTNEPKIQVLLSEIKGKDKLILFIDEIHTLIGAGAEGNDSLDFANIFKPGLDRGNIKIIGATTTDEYDRYILTDKAFVRRFQKIDVLEPTKEHTVKILMGSLPKLEYKTGAKLKYTEFIQEKIMTFIVDLTTEYRRVYELSARYPDIALTILQQAFSYAVFDNKKEVGIRDVRKAIYNTKLVYPDVIKKELVRFNELFSDIYLMETKQRLKGE